MSVLAKKAPDPRPGQGFRHSASQVEGRQAPAAVFLLDACYLLEKIRSSHSIYEMIDALSRLGDVIVTQAVYDEVRQNLRRVQPNSSIRSLAISDIQRAAAAGMLSIEKAEVEPGFLELLARLMESGSAKHNRRVGMGEASIMQLIDTLGDLYTRVVVLSHDSDIGVLAHMSERAIMVLSLTPEPLTG